MIPKHTIILIQAIKDTRKKLLPKENEFLFSVSTQAKQNRLLTHKQSKYLQDIYAKVTGGGQYQSREYSI